MLHQLLKQVFMTRLIAAVFGKWTIGASFYSIEGKLFSAASSVPSLTRGEWGDTVGAVDLALSFTYEK